jgi:hypothetical protein
MRHAIYAGECEHHLKDGRVGRFKPNGPLHVVHVRAERTRGRAAEGTPENELPFDSELEPWGTGGFAARLFVGLKVGNTLKWSIDDVMKATYGYLRVGRKHVRQLDVHRSARLVQRRDGGQRADRCF